MIEELFARYKRLLHLLETDEEVIAQSLDGELKEAYQKGLKKERQVVSDNLKLLQKTP